MTPIGSHDNPEYNWEDQPNHDYQVEWRIGIQDIRSLHGIVTYAINTWPGYPARPVEEQQYLLYLKSQLHAMMLDYTFAQPDAKKST